MWDKFKSSLPSKLLPASQLRPDALAFAAPLPVKPLSLASSPWTQACHAYTRVAHLNAPPIPTAPFASYGSLHLAVADLLLERGDELRQQSGQRIVHISSAVAGAGAAGLLAVYSPAQRVVQVRMQSTAMGNIVQAQQLVMRVMPASAQPLEGVAALGFETVPLAGIFWHYGQSAVQALGYVPDLQQHILRIRRFPPLEPASLLLRHLRLLHLLGQGNYSFESLLPTLSQEQLATLCPDLASLYLTGALSLKEA